MVKTPETRTLLFLAVLPLFLAACLTPAFTQDEEEKDPPTEQFRLTVERNTDGVLDFNFKTQKTQTEDVLVLRTERTLPENNRKGNGPKSKESIPDIPGEKSTGENSSDTEAKGKITPGKDVVEARITRWAMDINTVGLQPPSEKPLKQAVQKILNKPFTITVEKDGLVLFGDRFKKYLENARNIHEKLSKKERIRQKEIDEKVRQNGGYPADLYKKYRFTSWELREKFVREHVLQPDYFRNMLSPGWIRPLKRKFRSDAYTGPLGKPLLMDHYDSWDADNYGTFPSPFRYVLRNAQRKNKHLFLQYRVDSDLFFDPESAHKTEPMFEKNVGNMVVRDDGVVMKHSSHRKKVRDTEHIIFDYDLTRERLSSD